MTIYIDIVIIENLILNYIILYTVGLISKTKIRYLRIIIASFIGAIYAIIEYISNSNIYSSILLKTVLSIIIIFISFNPQNWKEMLKKLILFYLTTFTFGGIATYLIYVLKPQNIIIRNGLYVGTYILKVLFIGAILGTGIITMAFKVVKKRITKKDLFCRVKISLNKKTIILKTMIDTGNMLKDPLTGNPVIIVEHTKLYDLIPKEILNNLESILGGDWQKVSDDIREQYISKLKIIPFKSLGKENGMLLGIKAECIEILDNEIENKKENVIVGIYEKTLTKRDEYNALIGMELY